MFLTTCCLTLGKSVILPICGSPCWYRNRYIKKLSCRPPEIRFRKVKSPYWSEADVAQGFFSFQPVYHNGKEGRKEMFYLTTHSTDFIYGYMASDILLRTILIVSEETRCRHIGYSFRFAARVLLYALSHRQDSTYHGLCYTVVTTTGITKKPWYVISCLWDSVYKEIYRC